MVVDQKSAEVFHLSVLESVIPIEILRKEALLLIDAALNPLEIVFLHLQVEAKTPKSGNFVGSNTLLFDTLRFYKFVEGY